MPAIVPKLGDASGKAIFNELPRGARNSRLRRSIGYVSTQVNRPMSELGVPCGQRVMPNSIWPKHRVPEEW